MKTDPKMLMAELAEGSDTIIASPQRIQALEQQGIPFQHTPAPTLEEKFAKQLANAHEVIPHLPELPPVDLLPHAIRSLYQEILDCIIFGVNGAAITLCGNLIEFTLKHATFVMECKGYQNYDPQRWDEFEAIDLADAIGRAKRARILSSKLAKRIDAFREDIRNPYSHYNIRKITEDVIAGRVKVANWETGEVEERDIPASEDPNIQAVAKPIVDKKSVVYVFHFATEVVKTLLTNMEEELKKPPSE